jgi:predicted glycosyltransferase
MDTPRQISSAASRIWLHSHDSFGLGHLRRTLTLAGAIAARLEQAQVLVSTGSAAATQFPLPPGVEVLKLPSATKDADGALVSRALRASLGELVGLRSATLAALARSFRPHVFLADHQPLGLAQELGPALSILKRQGAYLLLGLRDIIDEPSRVAEAWSAPAVREALSCLYDRVLVYGSPTVFDIQREYPVPSELGQRLEYVGYVVREGPQSSLRPLPAMRPSLMVTMGGGEDGAKRIERVLDALELREADFDTTLILGPLLDSEGSRALKRRARAATRVSVHQFHADLPRLLAESQAVVSMAGYNSVAEILQVGLPAVLLPRTFPRREQALRAERLARLGQVRSLESPSAEELRAAIDEQIARPRQVASSLDLDGRSRVAEIVAGLFDGSRASARAGSVLQ